jgi:hypothetical protein
MPNAMAATNYDRIAFTRLTKIPPDAIIATAPKVLVREI